MHCVRWLANALLRQARLDGDEVERAMFRLANWQDGLGTRPPSAQTFAEPRNEMTVLGERVHF